MCPTPSCRLSPARWRKWGSETIELRAIGSAEMLGPVSMVLIGPVASVGILATEAERFRSRGDADGGSSGAPEPSSRRKRGCAPESRDEREVKEATSGGRKGAV